MRRKFFQEFVNSFCQRVIDLPSGYDLASFAHYGSGSYEANILSGECTHNGASIRPLELCDIYDKWMVQQMDKHRVGRDGIRAASLRMEVKVEDIEVRSSFASAHFFFECESEIATDEKSYVGRIRGDKKWGFDWYYQKLYDALPEEWPRRQVRP